MPVLTFFVGDSSELDSLSNEFAFNTSSLLACIYDKWLKKAGKEEKMLCLEVEGVDRILCTKAEIWISKECTEWRRWTQEAETTIPSACQQFAR